MNLEDFILKNSGHSISFGKPENAPSDEWIANAQDALGVEFPPSYKFFLKNYGGGEIHGDEIFSIYQIPFDQAVGGDIVFQTASNKDRGFLNDGEIAICWTDYGELFFMDGNNPLENGEYPVVIQTGKERHVYANSFSEFIVKFVGDAAV